LATAGFNVFIELSVVHLVPHIMADRVIATEPENGGHDRAISSFSSQHLTQPGG
jgi:hypothetical protein